MVTIDAEQTAVYLQLLGTVSLLPAEQRAKVQQITEQLDIIAQSDEGRIALALVGAKLASEN